MTKRFLPILLAMMVCLAQTATAAISYTSGGTITFDFTAAPTPADGWSTTFLGNGSGAYATAAALDAAVIANASAANINQPFLSTATQPPSIFGSNRWNSAYQALQSRPTGVGATLLLATLQNESGAAVPQVTVTYDLAAYVPVGTNIVEEVPAYRVYYSFTGNSNEWTAISELSVALATPGTNHISTVVGLPGGWQPNTPLYLLWADDNAAAGNTTASQEGGYTIDNFSVSPGASVAPSITRQPASTNINEGQVALLSVAATGTSLTYQWFKGTTAIPGATNPTLAVTNTSGSNRPWSVPNDSGTYHVVVSGSVNPPATSVNATVTVTPDTIGPVAEYADCTTAPGEVVLHFTETLDDFDPAVTNAASYLVQSTSGATPAVTNVTHTFGSPRVHVFVDQAIDPNTAYHITILPSLHDRAVSQNSLPANLRLPILCSSNHIAGLDYIWKYSDVDVLLPATWMTVGYNDAGTEWKQGPGILDSKAAGGGGAGTDCRDVVNHYPNSTGLGPVGTCLNHISPLNAPALLNTAYFRTHFNSPQTGGSNALLHLQGKIDDGAIIYLNGLEINRLRMPSGPVTPSTSATVTVADGDAQDVIELFVPGLVAGDNLLAIEVHQSVTNSSDMTLGLNISLVTAGLSTGPRLSITRNGNLLTISWAESPGIRLEAANNVTGPWNTYATIPTCADGTCSVSVDPTVGPYRFFRLAP